MAEDIIKVFLADRSPELALLLRDALAQRGIEIEDTALSGAQALEKLRRARPDVLLTELLLPELDGLSLLRTLREEKRMPATVVLSAFCNDRVARDCAQLGVDFFLTKPCAVDALCACIREAALGGGGVRPSADLRVREALLRFPIPAHLNGYSYLCTALERVLEDRRSLQGVTKALYRDIAREERTTAECVERSMRAAIVRGWEKGGGEHRRREFGSAFAGLDRPPTITRFLSIMAEQIALESADRGL